MTVPSRIILATASRWRAKLLEDAGLLVELVPAPIDEAAVTAPTPVALALARAAAKADAVAGMISTPGAIIIGADQVAHVEGEAFGKPSDPADHRRRLRALRGRWHTLSTGVAFRGPGAAGLDAALPGTGADFVEHTRIRFRDDLTDVELDAYVASGDGSGCAGGYRAEGPGAWLIAQVDGDWANVIGLPVFGVLDRLRRCAAAAR